MMTRSKRILSFCVPTDDRICSTFRLMRRILCYTILWIGYMIPALRISGQNNTIDSLQKRLLVQQEDTNKALTLNRLSENLIDERQARKAMVYANESIVLSHKLDFKRIEGS